MKSPLNQEGFFFYQLILTVWMQARREERPVRKRILLSPRLSCLKDWVPKGARLVDVGTDHGFLPVCLLLEEICPFVIASDIGEGPLERAKKTAKRYDVIDQMVFVRSDGLTDISPQEVDTIVMAGMGGETIAHILEHAPWVHDPKYTLLLQPMSKGKELRQFLMEKGYEVEREKLVEEPPFLYHVLLARGGGKPQRQGDLALYYGSQALWASGDPLLQRYWERTIKKLNRAIEGLQKSKRPESAIRCSELEEERAALERKRREI